MLTHLSLSNFKSWAELPSLRFAPFTGLFGANSSGKTSILQLLLMLKQTVESPDRAQVLDLGSERGLVSLGSFRDILFARDTSATLKYSLQWSLQDSILVPDTKKRDRVLFEDCSLKFSAAICGNGSGRPHVQRMAYEIDKQVFEIERETEDGTYALRSKPEGRFEFNRTRGRAWPLPAPVKCYGLPDQVRAYYRNAGFLTDFELAFTDLFSQQIYYLGPLRDYPHRQYTWTGSEPSDMGQRGERVVEALLAGRERGAGISRGKGKRKWTLEICVAHWLKEIGLIQDFSVNRVATSHIYEVRVKKDNGSAPVLITDVGFGVSQILPVITLCYYAPPGSTILLEQPEIHLHPSVQAGLADVFIDAINTRNVQIVLESHSEHLLRRLQRRIAEERLTNNDTALYFCTLEDGRSRATPLDIDLTGSIRNWPKDFFGDEFGEIAAQQKAILRRKKAVS